ncbi:MAG: methylenetetrahydrofolate reductase C-terminal domain-containing protein [Candidatus Riflebacteria bacterium]|nr:methylenetetrahydrofolate reductase C-terminal domain-containing protein [Candidatus Riflebacteria bacterium]
MIKTVPIPAENLLRIIPADKKIGVLGCGECAAAIGTGGTKQVDAWVERLKDRNSIIFSAVAKSPCDQRLLERFVGLIQNFDDAEIILLLACHAGVQSLDNLLRRRNQTTLLIPALTVDGFGWLAAGRRWTKACVFCPSCTFDTTATAHSGVGALSCPTAICPLRKIDGPCQNRLVDDRCPIVPESICTWLQPSENVKS